MSSLTSRAGLSCLIAPQGVSARRIESASKSKRLHVLAVGLGKECELVHGADHAAVGRLRH